jgi:hypothetical protein
LAKVPIYPCVPAESNDMERSALMEAKVPFWEQGMST